MTLARNVARVIRAEGVRAFWSKLKGRFYSTTDVLGLRRDLETPFDPPPATIAITVRPATAAEIETLLTAPDHGLCPSEVQERRVLLELGISQPYVAVTAEGRPCYMQWLMGPADNDRIQRYSNRGFPRLAENEALLDCAYTPPEFRGLRIMPCAMAQIAARASALGARWVLTFVVPGNTPSLKGCKRAGFVPHLRKRDAWRFFGRRVTFERLAAGTGYPFDTEPAARPGAVLQAVEVGAA